MNPGYLVTNSLLLANLNTYISEDEISASISELRIEFDRINSVSGPSVRTLRIDNEIIKLEEQLAYSKSQANIRTQQYRKASSNLKK